jgi:uncharacterized protein YraI
MGKRILWLIGLIFLFSLTFTANADGFAAWTGQYFNNPYLSPPVAFTRQDSGITFNWGAGSPGAGIGVDNFSARWTASVFFPQGAYRFWAAADDNIRVTVDGQIVVDTFPLLQTGQLVSGDLGLNAGTHNIMVDYREQGGNAFAYVSWESLADGVQGPDFTVPGQPPPIPTPIPNLPAQWTAQYYANNSLSGQPSVIVTEPNPTHNWGAGSPYPGLPSDNFSARWSSVQTLNGGIYRLTVRADDGVRVIVNGILVINEWHDYRNQTFTADVNVVAGQNSITIEYFENAGDAFITFDFQPASTVLPGSTPGLDFGSTWLAYYFSDANLTSTPVAIVSETSPTHNWGSSAPLPSVPADNFSVRWTTIQILAAGTYRATAQVDDGVRVYVDGTRVIDEWHGASGRTYSADFNLTAGPHTFVVEYYEAGGDAFITFTLGPATPVIAATQPPAAVPGVEQPRETGASATVGVYRVNVRDIPSTRGSNVIAKINPNETYSIVGRVSDNSWWQLNVNGVFGWVFSNYVNVANTQNVPITFREQTIRPQGTGVTATVSTNVVIRKSPSASGGSLGSLSAGQTATVIGRTADGRWLQINYLGVTGWVASFTVRVSGNLSSVPITG